MQSRRDQVQAYFFVVGRLISAMMQGRPDDPATPTRRFVMGAVIGTIIGCLVVAGFGVYGLIRPGGKTSWQEAGAIIVEKETGARYLYIDGSLRPVLNYSSALLAANNPAGGSVKLVSQASLEGARRGAPIGIQGAPDSLPDAGNLSTAPWVVCAATETAPSGAEQPITDLQVRRPTGTVLNDDQGVLVSTPDGATYLVWQGKRLRLPPESLNALGYAKHTPFPVTSGWINTLSSGPDLIAPDVPGIGTSLGTVGGRAARVGQVYEMNNPVLETSDYYVLRQDGFAPLNQTMASLLVNDPDTAAAYGGQKPELIRLGIEALSEQPTSAADSVPEGFPSVPPQVERVDVGGSTRPCVAFGVNKGNAVTAKIGLVPRGEATGKGRPPSGAAENALADRITVPPNQGILARDLPTPGVAAGTNYLISDLGVKYPLATPEVAGVLGYSGSAPMAVPSALLNLLPSGPSLDPASATVEQPLGITPAAN